MACVRFPHHHALSDEVECPHKRIRREGGYKPRPVNQRQPLLLPVTHDTHTHTHTHNKGKKIHFSSQQGMGQERASQEWASQEWASQEWGSQEWGSQEWGGNLGPEVNGFKLVPFKHILGRSLPTQSRKEEKRMNKTEFRPMWGE